MPVLASYYHACDICGDRLSNSRGFAPHLDGTTMSDLRAFAGAKWWQPKRGGKWLCDRCRPDFCHAPLPGAGPLICHLRPRHQGDHGYLPLQNKPSQSVK